MRNAHYICSSQNGHIGGNSVKGHILVLWIHFSLLLKVVVLTYKEIQVNNILETNDETELEEKIFSTGNYASMWNFQTIWEKNQHSFVVG